MNKSCQAFALAALLATTAAFQMPLASTTATTQTYPLVRVTSSVPAYGGTIRSSGYVPGHDFDSRPEKAKGDIGEEKTMGIIDGLKSGRAETKTDYLALKTGNVYVEYSCRWEDGVWHDSGILTTDADVWVFCLVHDGAVISSLCVDVSRLKRLCDDAPMSGHMTGDHPTKGFLVSLRILQGF